jgi:phosphate transport system permease protein
MLGAVASIVLILIAAMIGFVFSEAWPSFRENGLAWFGSQGDLSRQFEAIIDSPSNPAQYNYTIGAWPVLWATFVITAGALIIATVASVLSAIFIVEFAPPSVNRVLEPVVRLLAAVPSSTAWSACSSSSPSSATS